MLLLLLNGCPGYFFSIPAGPIVIGAGQDAGGDVYVGGAATESDSSANAAIRLPTQQHDSPFADDPYTHDPPVKQQQTDDEKDE